MEKKSSLAYFAFISMKNPVKPQIALPLPHQQHTFAYELPPICYPLVKVCSTFVFSCCHSRRESAFKHQKNGFDMKKHSLASRRAVTI
jgi:hypothetical protein